jgi:hypothetical protein
MIDHCDSSFLHRRFDGERLPLSHQLPAPPSGSPVSGLRSPVSTEARRTIERRDKHWALCKLFELPSPVVISELRLRNDAVLKLLAVDPAPFLRTLNHVETLLCRVCDIYCTRCELEILAETERLRVLNWEFVRRSFAMAMDEEEPPPTP